MKIACVGDNCIDYCDETKEYFPGGNPVNVAVYSAALGNYASYIGVVGDDEMGRIMIQALMAKGIDTSHLRIKKGSTALTHVTYDMGERIFGEYEEGVMADFTLLQEDIDFICSHDIIVSGIWGKIEGRLPEIADRCKKIAFDFSDKLDSPIVEQAAPYLKYAFFSYKEDDPFIREYLRGVNSLGTGLCVATLGEKGSLAFDGREFVKFGIVPCEAVDTLGAGDSYIAGFLNAEHKGYTLAECMEQGAKNSTRALMVRGAW